MIPCRWIVLMTRLHYRLNPSFSGGDMYGAKEIRRLKLGQVRSDMQLQIPLPINHPVYIPQGHS
jgi:hypothetical protein